MKIDEFLAKNKEQLLLIVLGLYFIGYAGFNYISIQFNKFYFDQAASSSGSNEIYDTIVETSHSTVHNNMPYLIGIGIAIILFGVIYQNIKKIALPLYILLFGVLIFWTINYNQDVQKMFEALNQIYSDTGLYDHTPSILADFLKATQNPGYIQNASMFLIPMGLVGFFLFYFFKRKKDNFSPH